MTMPTDPNPGKEELSTGGKPRRPRDPSPLPSDPIEPVDPPVAEVEPAPIPEPEVTVEAEEETPLVPFEIFAWQNGLTAFARGKLAYAKGTYSRTEREWQADLAAVRS